MTRLVFDIDFILFAAASVAEETFITAVHTPTGLEQEFENRTQLWGHHGKKNTGWIGLQNEMSDNEFYKSDDFVVTEGQRPRPFRIKGEDGEPDTFLTPLEGAKAAVTLRIQSICRKLMAESYTCFTGRGNVFRHDLATLLPYKGNRGAAKPLILEQLKDWAVEAHFTTIVRGIEADDAVAMATLDGYNAWVAGGKEDEDKLIAVAIDKDSKGTSGFHFNPDKDEDVRFIEGLGSLWLDKKGNVDGAGRMFLYWQVAHGDSTDNYVANCFSDKKYAGKGAYNDLVDCTTDKEAFTALVGVFNKLYPEPKTVEGCKGMVDIDAIYVMQEMFSMAMMLRKPGDKMCVKTTLAKMGIPHGN